MAEPRTTVLLRDLVALPSQNPMGRPIPGEGYLEGRVTDYLETFFRRLGVPWERHPVAPGRDNVLARYEAPGSARHLLWEVHQDTVPAGQMTVDPFGANVENGRLYGRGACDVKAGMAAMLDAFARLVETKPAGAASVTVACVVDEEYTFLGIQDLARRGVKADFAVVAEPTNLHVVNAHKGVVRWFLQTNGRACHSSRPDQGVNAIYRMAKLVTGIEVYAAELSRRRVHPRLGPATLSVGRIEGGVSVNVVPERCRIEIDRRVLPGEDAAAAPAELDEFLRQEMGIDWAYDSEPPWMCLPALNPEGSTEAVLQLGTAIAGVTGKRPVVEAVPYGTDAATLAQTGLPCVVFGPGDIAKAHTADEWVPLDEVATASAILFRLAAEG
jgi:acetylornithine deacetylase